MPIDTQHTSYKLMIDEWQKIDDIVKANNVEDYLVELNPNDTSADNTTRNEQYQDRAIFYRISGQTVQGMVGSIFRKWPSSNVPDSLSYLAENADGAGVSIYQQSQALCGDVLQKGRSGLLVSFPHTEGQVSQADMVDGRVVATIHRFEPEQIINWRTTRDGSRVKLSLVVIQEATEEPEESDPYYTESVNVIRELYLEDGIYWERLWREGDNGWEVKEEYMPLDYQGNPWQEIPFIFVGSENNDPSPDLPPMSGIVDLNIGHYRNSADFEDSVWFCGQAQPWMSGITQDHVNLLHKNNMYVGSRNMIGVPEGEQFGFAQASPNPLVKQAMEDKVQMMIALGARMMQTGSATKTASQIMTEREAQTSLLALVASNTSEAYTRCLQWAGRYMGIEDPEMHYTLSQEFLALTADPQMAQMVMQGFLQGTVPLPDYVRWMKRSDLFDDERTIEEYADFLPVGGNLE
jgi:hypothetical protein